MGGWGGGVGCFEGVVYLLFFWLVGGFCFFFFVFSI